MKIDKKYAEAVVRGTLMPIARRAETARDLDSLRAEVANIANAMIAVLEKIAE